MVKAFIARQVNVLNMRTAAATAFACMLALFPAGVGRTPDGFRCGLREPGALALPSRHGDHARVRPLRQGRSSRPAEARRLQRAAASASGVLPCDDEDRAVAGLGHPIRSLAADVGVERQVSPGRQRRVGRIDPVRTARRRAAPRLCRGLDRHRSHGYGRQLRDGPSGEADRFRLSLGPRNRGAGQGDGRGALRRAAAAVVFQRLLRRRPDVLHGSAALPGRLRRHHRGRARLQPDRRGVSDARHGAGDTRQPGQLHPRRQVSSAAPGGARRLRCARRAEGRPDCRPA